MHEPVLAHHLSRIRSRGVAVEAARLAREQYGAISWAQLREIGYAEATVTKLVDRGALHRIWPAVYAHGHPVLTRDGWLMGATLACGTDAHLAARASGAARGLLRAWSRIDVATTGQRGVTLPGIRAHRVVLRPEERDVHRGLPVTSLARTALDIAAAEGYGRTGELLDEALLAGQYDYAEMLELLEARHGCRWPEPRVNAWFPTRAGHGHELDLWWPDLQLNFELDGPRHALPHQRRLDALRDADLRSFGVEIARFPSEDVRARPDLFLDLTARLLFGGR